MHSKKLASEMLIKIGELSALPLQGPLIRRIERPGDMICSFENHGSILSYNYLGILRVSTSVLHASNEKDTCKQY